MARTKTPRSTTPIRTSSSGAAAAAQMAPEAKRTVGAVNLQEEIQRRAYELYQQRGCEPGHEDEDWLIAEQEILARHSQRST